MKFALSFVAIGSASAINIRSHFSRTGAHLQKHAAVKKHGVTRSVNRDVTSSHYKPNIFEQQGEEPVLTETEGECKCPESFFWAPLAGVDGRGECMPQYGLGEECGMFQEEVRARVCLAGSKCVPTSETQVDTNGAAPGGETVAADADGNSESGTPLNGAYQTPENNNDLSPSFGLPAKCVSCSQEELDSGICAHTKNCAKTATVSGKMCIQVKVEHASCGDHTTGTDHHVEATATATASATATADAEVSGSVSVSATHEGNTATVNVPVTTKQKVTVTKEVTTEANGSASVNTGDGEIVVDGKSPGFVEKCVTTEEAVMEIEAEIGERMPAPLTLEQAHRLVDHMKIMATHKAKDSAVEKASEDACEQAQEQAETLAKAEAVKAAEAAADEEAEGAANAAAGAAAAAASSDNPNAAARAALTPEDYQKAHSEALDMAKGATQASQELAGAQGSTTAQAEDQTTGAAAAVTASAQAEGPGIGVKQTAGDVAASQP